LIMRCLAKQPADRPQSAEQLLGDLEAMATPTGGTLSELSAISSGTQAALRRSHPVRIATLFGFAALGVLTLVHLLVQLLRLPAWRCGSSASGRWAHWWRAECSRSATGWCWPISRTARPTRRWDPPSPRPYGSPSRSPV